MAGARVRAPRARIEAHGDPRRQAWGERRRAANSGGTIRLCQGGPPFGVVKRPKGA